MDDLYRENILEHYKKPRHWGELADPDLEFEDFNPLCGDELKVQLDVAEDGPDARSHLDPRSPTRRRGRSAPSSCRRAPAAGRQSTQTSRYASSPWRPPSRPKPDSLYPPNGDVGSNRL